MPSPIPLFAALLALAGPQAGPLQDDLSGVDRRVFKRPIRLRTAEAVIDAANGHAAPCFADLDGDGLPDLLVGEFGTRPFPGRAPAEGGVQPVAAQVRFYKNVGTRQRPRFAPPAPLAAGGQPLAVPAECCIGAVPRLADLDADGIPDLVSGSDTGEVFWFRGLGGGRFAAPTALAGPAGAPYAPGLAVTADLGDLDGDGDLDLVLATSEAAVYVVENQGTPPEPRFADLKWRLGDIDGESLWGSDAVVADWDADGRDDLLVGTDAGGVAWYPNVGDGPRTRYGRREWILREPLEDAAEQEEGSVPRRPGRRLKVHAADYDGDGTLDLFVGDLTTQLRPSAERSADELAEWRRVRGELADAAGRYARLLAQWRTNPPVAPLPPTPPPPPEEEQPDPHLRRWPKPYAPPVELPIQPLASPLRPGAVEAGKLSAEVESARAAVERLSLTLRNLVPAEPTHHGWVWVYRRRQ